MQTRRLAAVPLIALAVAAAGAAPAPAADSCTPPLPMKFGPQGYIEMERAGGEPTITTLPDGTLLYGAHAGTTHFYTPTAADPATIAFGEHYEGQTYIWRSADDGKTWTFIDRKLPTGTDPNAPGSGFSDPEWAIDAAGQVYASEINLVNVAVSKSTDGGKTFALQNFFGQTVTDRQWKDADQKDEVYIVGNAFAGGTFPTQPVGNNGHFLYKSVDGGKTWSEGLADGDGLGDIIVDKRDGTLYETYYGDGQLKMAAYRGLRGKPDLTGAVPELSTIAANANMGSHWPSFAIDRAGNIYVTWDERGRNDNGRPAGIYYAASTDGARTWSGPFRVDTNDNTKIWPWLTIGDTGRVAIAWLEAEVKLPDHNAEESGDHGWRIMAAHSDSGLGCAGGGSPAFTTSVATPDPVHHGTICEGGTICQAQAVDRRLGDYFSISTDRHGRVWAGYSDTREGGGVALPGYVHATDGGPSLIGGAGPAVTPPKPTTTAAPALRVRLRAGRVRLGTARRRGLPALVSCTTSCSGTIVARRGKASIGRASFSLPKAGRASVTIRLTAKAARSLRRARRVRLTLTAAGRDAAGRRAKTAHARVTLRR